MSVSDEVTFDAPTPAKKKTAKKAAKKARPVAAVEKSSGEPFPGMTRTACADGCDAKGCVISQKSYCAHPCKGGLHSSDQGDPAALKRMQRARGQLDVQIDPNRFK